MTDRGGEVGGAVDGWAERLRRLAGVRPHQVFDRLERAGRWRTLAVLGSAYWTVRQRRWCLITRRDGRWVHRFREGAVVSPSLFVWPPGGRSADAFFWDYEPRPGDAVLDVGAGIGGEALMCSRFVGPSGRVVSVEPNPTMFSCLDESVRINRLSNVARRQVAITDREGEVTITDDENLIANHLVADGGAGVRVAATTLDQLAREEGIDRIALLKMNIEGSERPALEVAAGLLAHTDHAVIACHDFLADPDDPDDPMRTREPVAAILQNAGFTVSTRPDHPLPWVRDFVYAVRPAVSAPRRTAARPSAPLTAPVALDGDA